MAIRVTKPVTKYGRYYAAGETISEPSGLEWSMYRLLGWEQVDDSKPLSGMNKTQLLQLADGLETAGLTRKQLIELLK